MIACPTDTQIRCKGIKLNQPDYVGLINQIGIAAQLRGKQLLAIGAINIYLIIIKIGTQGKAKSIAERMQIKKQGASKSKLT